MTSPESSPIPPVDPAMTDPTPVGPTRGEQLADQARILGWDTVARNTEWRAGRADDKAETSEQEVRFVRNIGHTATERLLDINYVAPETDTEVDDRLDHIVAGIGSGEIRDPDEAIARGRRLAEPEAVLVRPQTRRERKIDERMEKKLNRHARRAARQRKAENISRVSPGRIDKSETRAARKTYSKELRRARKNNEITARELTQGLHDTVMITHRMPSEIVANAQKKTTRESRDVIKYADKIEKRAVKRHTRAVKRAERLNDKATQRRARYNDAVDARRMPTPPEMETDTDTDLTI